MTPDIQSKFIHIQDLIDRDPLAIAFVGGVASDWIRKAETALGLKFPPSFIEYLLRYGGGAIGGEQINGLLGVEFDEACGPDIVYNTLIERREFNIHHGYICIVNNDGDEMFYLDTSQVLDNEENPVVRITSDDLQSVEIYTDSFADFLIARLEFFLSV